MSGEAFSLYPTCPVCGNKARMTKTKWGKRYDCCGLYAWGKYPLVSREVHEKRKEAHRRFDVIWRDNLMSRGKAYSEVARRLGIPTEECHFKLMTPPLLDRAIRVVTIYRDQLYKEKKNVRR